MSTHYPEFDVLTEQTAWDEYTRSIVLQRLNPPALAGLTGREAALLSTILRHLLAEDREDVLTFATSHVDQRLDNPLGEGQRHEGTPPEAELVHLGLAAIDAVAQSRHGSGFASCQAQAQFEILAALQKGQVPELEGFPQSEFFKKLLGMAVAACASHPTVWSEMGYPGPAYPRGYYRLDLHARDPWEAEFAPPRTGGADTAAEDDADDVEDRGRERNGRRPD